MIINRTSHHETFNYGYPTYVKVKVHPITGPEGPRGGVGV
jgi:hypothetical protein